MISVCTYLAIELICLDFLIGLKLLVRVTIWIKLDYSLSKVNLMSKQIEVAACKRCAWERLFGSGADMGLLNSISAMSHGHSGA